MGKSTQRRSPAASQAALRARQQSGPADPPAPLPAAVEGDVDRLVAAGWSRDRAEALIRRHGPDVLRLPAPRRSRETVNDLDRLRRVGRSLRELESRRSALLQERALLVEQLRARGESWDRLAQAARVTRPTLIQARGPR